MSICNVRRVLENAVDLCTNSLKMISSDNASIHNGECYVSPIYLNSLSFGQSKNYLLHTSSNKDCHVKGLMLSCKGATLKAKIIVRSDITDNGTELENTFKRLNSNITTEAESKIYQDTIFENGVDSDFVIAHGTTANNGKMVGEGVFIPSPNFEYVLSKNTKYILNIENIDTDENTAIEIYTRLVLIERE